MLDLLNALAYAALQEYSNRIKQLSGQMGHGSSSFGYEVIAPL